MAISFLIQSSKNPSPIYVRLREGRSIDAKAKTGLQIDPSNFKSGKVKQLKMLAGANAEIKKAIQLQNDELNAVQISLDGIRNSITNALNNRKEYETINSDWLKQIINPKEVLQAPTLLTAFFDYYLDVRKGEIEESTSKKIKVIRKRLESFQEDYGIIHLQDVNRAMSASYRKWNDENNFAHNTKLQTLKVLLTVCNYAKEFGLPTHPELQYITKGLKFHKNDEIHLTLQEIEQIDDTKLLDQRLIDAKDWLVISCYTAQRVSDFLNFTKDDVFKDTEDPQNPHFCLMIKQKKTGAFVGLPLHPRVVNILNKRNGNFPPVFSKNNNSNATIYNNLIKDVCKLAGLGELVTVKRKAKKSNRYKETTIPKWKAVSTHIGRRSFASNYYNKINTPLLIAATGHSTERQFLTYVGKAARHNSSLLMQGMLKVDAELSRPKEEILTNMVAIR